MIVATAGHIDHGKTLLVKSLTGIDTDRLPDEKRRGLTIDLGFAYQDVNEVEVLGFVDVPGHERFVRNMLAGVTNIDYALLVVAADDGVMPQTIEHLDILNLLGVKEGAVVISKIDRVDDDRLDEVELDIAGLLEGTPFENADVFRVSALSGDGIDPLHEHLPDMAQLIDHRQVKGHFRMAVDRCFTLSGAGLVVTGSVFSGNVHTGDRVMVSPSGMPARVRSLHAQNRVSEIGVAGQRCALNITGRDLKKSAVHRGDWIVAEAAHAPSDRIDVEVQVLASEPRPLRHWTPVHVHIGAADIPGRIATLETRSIAPGEYGLAQLVLDSKTNIFRGDRFIVRDQSAKRTLGGGTVVDPFGLKRGRARPERIEHLTAMNEDSPESALVALVQCKPKGVDIGQFMQAWNLSEADASALIDALKIQIIGSEKKSFAFSPEHWQTLQDQILSAVQTWHQEKPESPGLTLNQVNLRLPSRLTEATLEAVVAAMTDSKQLARRNELVSSPEHKPAVPPQDLALWELIKPVLQEAGLRPPTVRELAAEIGKRPDQVQRFLDRSIRRGYVKAVSKNRYFLPATLHRLGTIACEIAEQDPDGQFNAAAFRDKSGIGRNLTIELLEYFDKVKLTERRGDMRKIARSVDDIFQVSTDA